MAPTVKDIYIYPVKSCRGIRLESAVITNTGLAYDRHWVVVDADSGRFLSQRTNQKMALIDVDLPPEILVSDWGTASPDAALSLSAPGVSIPLQVPLNSISASDDGRGRMREVRVWEWRGLGRDEGDTAAAWLTEVLGQPCRLLRYAGAVASSLNDPTRRPLDPHWVDPDAGYETAFSDGFPFLLTSYESLKALNSALPQPVPMNRFRPNIVVAGLEEAFEEDRWAEMDVTGGPRRAAFQAPKPCARCKITTVNQSTGEAGKEPLRLLSSMRGINLGWKQVDSELVGAFFGWNLTSPSVGVTICVGDSLSVTLWRDRATLKPVNA